MIYTILKTSLYISYATPEGRAYAEEMRKSFRGTVKEEETGMWFESFKMEGKDEQREQTGWGS